MNTLTPIIAKLTLNSGTELTNVPAIESDLIEMGFTDIQVNELCTAANKVQQFDEIRTIRKPLLIESDYLVNDAADKDIDEAPFRQYRQDLKNITEGLDNPDDVVWPVLPKI